MVRSVSLRDASGSSTLPPFTALCWITLLFFFKFITYRGIYTADNACTLLM